AVGKERSFSQPRLRSEACVASPELLQVLLLGKRCWKRFVGFQPSAEIDGATRLLPPRYLEAHSALRDRRAPLGTVSAACASIRPEVATRRVPGDASGSGTCSSSITACTR